MESLISIKINTSATLRFWSEFAEKQVQEKISVVTEMVEDFVSGVENPQELIGDKSCSHPNYIPKEIQDVGDIEEHEKMISVCKESAEHFPFSAVGKLIFVRAVNGKPEVFSGSAFVINSGNSSTAVTAAHCLFSEEMIDCPSQWSQHLIFVPFYNQNHEGLKTRIINRSIYLAKELTVARRWVEDKRTARYEYDLACISLEKASDNQVDLIELTGALGWKSGPIAPEKLGQPFSLGYPEDERFSPQLWKSSVNLSFQKYVTGFPHIRMHQLGFSYGASGGPVIAWCEDEKCFLAVGLNSSLSIQPSGSRHWDSPRFGHVFENMLKK